MVIPTLLTLGYKKFFGKKKENDDGSIGDHPAVRFLFYTWTTGDTDETEEMVAPDFRGYANGYPIFEPEDGNGPEQFNKNIEYWRKAVSGLDVDLYDELAEKRVNKTDQIAIRFVFTGSMLHPDGEELFETEAAAFLTVVDKQLAEWRIVVDEGFFEHLRETMGLPAA